MKAIRTMRRVSFCSRSKLTVCLLEQKLEELKREKQNKADLEKDETENAEYLMKMFKGLTTGSLIRHKCYDRRRGL